MAGDQSLQTSTLVTGQRLKRFNVLNVTDDNRGKQHQLKTNDI